MTTRPDTAPVRLSRPFRIKMRKPKHTDTRSRSEQMAAFRARLETGYGLHPSDEIHVTFDVAAGRCVAELRINTALANGWRAGPAGGFQ